MPLRPWVGPKGRQGGRPYGRPGRAESLFPYFKAVYSALPFYIKPTRRPGAAAERGKETLYIFVHSGGEGKIKTMGWIFGIAGAAALDAGAPTDVKSALSVRPDGSGKKAEDR